MTERENAAQRREPRRIGEPEHTDRAGSPIGTEASLDPSPALDRALERDLRRRLGERLAALVAPGEGAPADIIEAEQRRLRTVDPFQAPGLVGMLDLQQERNRRLTEKLDEQRRLRLDTEEFRRTRADWDAAHAAYAARTGVIEVAVGAEAGDDDDRALAGLWGRTRLSGEALRVALAKVPR